ncbi:MAG TPA: non-canonical purine NTP pyrophosphatase [Candidatus Limnocylindria bacterium]
MSRLLVATNNPGKLAEFRRLLAPLDAELVTPRDVGLEVEVPEPHATYAENAAAKAVALCEASGAVTLGDDSGIEVAALGWAPGVLSARFAAGEGLRGADLLLDRLAGVTDRRARMVCWLALAMPDPSGHGRPGVEMFEGAVEGRIARHRRGGGGFGYDPIFELADGRTAAEVPDPTKDAQSHRGRAVAAALPRLREVLSAGARMPTTSEDA